VPESSGTPKAICDQTCSGTTLGNVAKIVYGIEHACALAGGAVRCWGWNNHGQLGDNSMNNENLPATTAIASGAIDVAAGGYHTCAILSDGTVRCWGWDGSGQLGDNDMNGTDKKAPVAPVW
jgi:alpha-tubulin suppressor-like RCC1 family protein